jgi:sensor histidine kinase YesM
MTLLTLVENAVKHGIDPSEDGGRIDVRVQVADDRCHARVVDTGIGFQHGTEDSLGTGLGALRERLQLTFGAEARLTLTPNLPHGVCADLHLPAWRQRS